MYSVQLNELLFDLSEASFVSVSSLTCQGCFKNNLSCAYNDNKN